MSDEPFSLAGWIDKVETAFVTGIFAFGGTILWGVVNLFKRVGNLETRVAQQEDNNKVLLRKLEVVPTKVEMFAWMNKSESNQAEIIALLHRRGEER